jgi:hypothetical protein
VPAGVTAPRTASTDWCSKSVLAALLLISVPAFGAAPPDADPSFTRWFRSLQAGDGGPCCSIADCRSVTARLTDDHYEVLIGAAHGLNPRETIVGGVIGFRWTLFDSFAYGGVGSRQSELSPASPVSGVTNPCDGQLLASYLVSLTRPLASKVTMRRRASSAPTA